MAKTDKKNHSDDEKTEALKKRSLAYSTAEGGLSSASSNITDSYTVPFLVSLKANDRDIGILTAIQNLASILAQIPGAKMTSRMDRKSIWVISTIISRLIWIPIIIVPFLLPSAAAILVIISLIGLFTFFQSFRRPAWTSMMGDLVSDDACNDYFSKRNMVAGIAGLALTLAGGFILSYYNFSVLFVVSIVLGLAAVAFFVKMYDPPMKKEYHYKYSFSFRSSNIKNFFRINRNYSIFTVYVTFLNFAVDIASPFFIVYILEDLKIDYGLFAIALTIGIVVKIVCYRYWGIMANKYGNRAILVVTGILISFVPFGYMFSTNIYDIIIVRMIDGFAWGGFDLILFNYLVGITPSDDRPSMVANHVFISGMGSVVAALVGGFIAMSMHGTTFFLFTGLQILFLISFLLRISATLISFKLKEVDTKSPNFSFSFVFWRTVAVEPARGIKSFRDILLGKHDSRYDKGKYEYTAKSGLK